MKSKKILVEAYIRNIYKEGVKDPMYAPDIHQTRVDFLKGFNSGKKFKWADVNLKNPKSDHHCLCWVENEDTPHWSTFKIGSYQNNNWYLQGGRESHERVTAWIKVKSFK